MSSESRKKIREWRKQHQCFDVKTSNEFQVFPWKQNNRVVGNSSAPQVAWTRARHLL